MTNHEDDALPPYQRIAARIRRKIVNGVLKPGDLIPSVNQIRDLEGVSTATATRVAAVLRAEGYVQSVPGIGTVVTNRRPITTGPDRLNLLRGGGTGYRDNERTRITDTGLVPAPQHVADALQVSAESDVIQRQRVYEDDEGVVAVSTSWLPGTLAEAAPELLLGDPLPKMTFGLVEERTGRRAVRRRDTVTAEGVPSDIAAVLGVDPDSPVLVMTNHYWDQHGDPTEFAIDYLSPGRALTTEYDIN